MRTSDLFVYLGRPVVGCRTRIEGARSNLREIDLIELSLRYDAQLESWNRSRKLLVRAADYDVLEGDEPLDELVLLIEEDLPHTF